MNQTNKEYLDFLVNSGVKYFLKNEPNNFYKIEKNTKKNPSLFEIKTIEELLIYTQSLENPLKKSSKKTVLYDGNLESDLMIIGEAPGKDEDDQGKPFVGMAGKLLNKMLAAINIKRENVYITNVVPWRPPNNRTPTEDEILECLPILQKQIEIINPKLIFLLGKTAAKAILTTPLQLSKLRKVWHTYKTINMNKNVNVLVSYHPAFLLRSPEFKKEAWIDLKILEKKIINEN